MKKGIILLTGLLVLSCVGCRQSETETRKEEVQGSEKSDGKEKDVVSEPVLEELTAWYQDKNMEGKYDIDSVGERFDRKVEYKGELDQSLLSGHQGHTNMVLKTPELSEEEVRKLGEFDFRRYTTSYRINVVEWVVSAMSESREKYRFIMRYGDRHRTKVLCYKNEQDIKDGKYFLSDSKEGKQRAGGAFRYCFERLEDKVETCEHPQLKRKVKGQILICEMDILEDADKGQIAGRMMTAVQNYVDEEIKENGDEDSKRIFLGIRLTVRQYGKEIAGNILYLWDKDKDRILPCSEPGGGRYMSQEELADCIDVSR